ncbi:MAG TPA: DUF1304 domain-containing protein [Jiangellaceae bacterium]
MNAVAQVFAVIAGLIHVGIFVVESVVFRRPQIHRRFLVAPEDVDVVRQWALNQGVYNLFLALGALGGVVVLAVGDETVGRTLVLFSCGCMVAAGLVLLATERSLARSALVQAVPPLVVLALAAV